VDFGKADNHASSVPGLLTFWQVVRGRTGRMALCNVCDHQKDKLQITSLDRSWLIYSWRSERLEAVRQQATGDVYASQVVKMRERGGE
jgi:hypothetical protein